MLQIGYDPPASVVRFIEEATVGLTCCALSLSNLKGGNTRGAGKGTYWLSLNFPPSNEKQKCGSYWRPSFL
jgi:hypothetical protein